MFRKTKFSHDPQDGDAKFANVWSIENVWGAIKEKIRGGEFDDEVELEKQVVQQWRQFTSTKCKQIMTKIPDRIREVINVSRDRIRGH